MKRLILAAVLALGLMSMTACDDEIPPPPGCVPEITPECDPNVGKVGNPGKSNRQHRIDPSIPHN